MEFGNDNVLKCFSHYHIQTQRSFATSITFLHSPHEKLYALRFTLCALRFKRVIYWNAKDYIQFPSGTILVL